MFIIGCDFHTRFQQTAMLESVSGEIIERRLDHDSGEAKRFYAALPRSARMGREASGHAHWFERMLAEQGSELWVGDAARIQAGIVRKQKTDPRDAYHILKMLLENRFPRIWIPSPAERDLRQLLQHGVRLVHFRTSVMNQWQALAVGQGLCRRKKLWTTVGRSELESLALSPWANRRKRELLEMLDRLSASIEELAWARIELIMIDNRRDPRLAVRNAER
ncbi:MAG: transposase [Acidobacteriia bacterium]|nr:transposase [Terriglobia bacterium]